MFLKFVSNLINVIAVVDKTEETFEIMKMMKRNTGQIDARGDDSKKQRRSPARHGRSGPASKDLLRGRAPGAARSRARVYREVPTASRRHPKKAPN